MEKIGFKEFVSSKKGKIIIAVLVGVLVVGGIIGLVIGATGNTGSSTLKVSNRTEIRERVNTKFIVPDVECTSGILLFGKSLTDSQMLERVNDEFIIKYEMVISRENESGETVGYIITATCAPGVIFEPSVYSSIEYEAPLYVSSDEEKSYPVYVNIIESQGENVSYIVSLSFEYNEQIFTFSVGITERLQIVNAINRMLIEIDNLLL